MHIVSVIIQPSHPLSPSSPPALKLSQHQGLSNELAHLRGGEYKMQEPRGVPKNRTFFFKRKCIIYLEDCFSNLKAKQVSRFLVREPAKKKLKILQGDYTESNFRTMENSHAADYTQSLTLYNFITSNNILFFELKIIHKIIQQSPNNTRVVLRFWISYMF